jgi:glycosyltransferase involved in cell wall biosynthesis
MLEKNLQGIPYRIITWSEQIEVLEIRNFSVGIMPLDDTPFNNGKCALKLVQYMAIGIPTISSPLLSNVNINRGSGNLFATTQDEWYSAFAQVIQNQEKYKNIGLMNREIALQHYTVQANVNKHLNIFSRLYKDL